MEDVDFLVPIIIVVLCVIYLIIILFEFDRRDLIIPIILMLFCLFVLLFLSWKEYIKHNRIYDVFYLWAKNTNGNGTCKCSHMDKYIKKTTVKQYIQNQ